MKKIEERYLVVKISDIKRAVQAGDISEIEARRMRQIITRVNSSRCFFKPPLKALVVEHDWPEYPVVQSAIEARINDLPATMMFSRAKGRYSLSSMIGYTSHLTKTLAGDPGELQIDEFKFLQDPVIKLSDVKLLKVPGVISQDQAALRARRDIPGAEKVQNHIKIFDWKGVDMSTGMEKWFEHIHCINWLSACPKCETTAARVKSSSMDSNHLLDNDAVECICCGNTGHIEIFNSDADVAWDGTDGQ